MKIVVCIKQVPDTTEVRLDPQTGTMIREGVPSIINPDDRTAIEAALALKDEHSGSTVTLLSMGPPQAEAALREGLAMGADAAILVSDKAYGGSDTWATSNVLAASIQKIGDFDLVLCGRQAIDGDTAQVGPQIAERLGLPQVTYVSRIFLNAGSLPDASLSDANLSAACLQVHRALEDGYQVVEAALPCLLTVVKELNSPRYPSIKGIFEAYREKTVLRWGQAELAIPADRIGLRKSPTNVRRTFSPQVRQAGVVLANADRDTARQLVELLLDRHVL